MQVSLSTQPGNPFKPNEDWVLATPSMAIVLDGLSTAGIDTGCRHGVPWYVSNLGTQIAAALTHSSVSLGEGLAIAIEVVAGFHPECDLVNPGTPSSTVSIVREGESVFEYLILADSPIIFNGKAGMEMLTDLRVDDVLAEVRAEVDRHETGSDAHTKGVAKLVRAQREIRNTPGGYWVAGSNSEAAGEAISGIRDKDLIADLALMSDGASCIVTEYKHSTWVEIFNLLRNEGPNAVVELVRRVEATDPHGHRWPRYKTGDDATVAHVTRVPVMRL
jgi:hypothetical protein